MEIVKIKGVPATINVALINSTNRPAYHNGTLTNISISAYTWSDVLSASITSITLNQTITQNGDSGLWYLWLTTTQMAPALSGGGTGDSMILKVKATEIDSQTILLKLVNPFADLDGVYSSLQYGQPYQKAPYGTPTYPTTYINDAIVIATANKLYNIYVLDGSGSEGFQTISVTTGNKKFIGMQSPYNGTSQLIYIRSGIDTHCTFEHLHLQAQNNSLYDSDFYDCLLDDFGVTRYNAFNCILTGTHKAQSLKLVNCHFNSVTIDLSWPATTIRIYNCDGTLHLASATASSPVVIIDGFRGSLFLDTSSIDATSSFQITGGGGKLVNNSSVVPVVKGFVTDSFAKGYQPFIS